MSLYLRAIVLAVCLASAAPAMGAPAEPPAPTMPPAAAAPAAPAAPGPAATPPAPAATEPAPKRFSLSLKAQGPRNAFAGIEKATGERILVDSTVRRGTVTAEWKGIALDEALTDACKQLRVSWKRVYLPPGTGAMPDNVSQIYRTLRNLVAGGLVALEPGGEKGTMLLLNASLPPQYRSVMEQPKTGFRRAILILDERMPLAAAQQAAAAAEEQGSWQPGQPLSPRKMAALSRGILVAMAQMSPEERQAALQMSMASQMEILSQNPQLLGQFVRESTGVQFQFLMQNPEMLQGVMQSAMQAQIAAIQEMTPQQRQMLVMVQRQTLAAIPPEQMQQLMQLFGGRGQ